MEPAGGDTPPGMHQHPRGQRPRRLHPPHLLPPLHPFIYYKVRKNETATNRPRSGLWPYLNPGSTKSKCQTPEDMVFWREKKRN